MSRKKAIIIIISIKMNVAPLCMACFVVADIWEKLSLCLIKQALCQEDLCGMNLYSHISFTWKLVGNE
jgi:hypothetical protein